VGHEDLLDHRAVLALEVAAATVDRDVVGLLCNLYLQATVGQRLSPPATPRCRPSSGRA
jgi:hypothetical protein